MVAGQTKYRVTLLLLGLAFIVVAVAAVLFAPSGSGNRLPDAVRRVSPGDGELVLRQARIELHLEAGYRATLVVDGVTIPAEDVIYTPETGLHIFEPGPGRAVAEWAPGFHVVEASWDRIGGLPDPGAMTWTFRVA